MDISAIAVVLILIVLFSAAVVWMEVQSRKTSSNDLRSDAKNSELRGTE